MNYSKKDWQEYIRFMLEVGNKVNEIRRNYNQLSDINKYRLKRDVEELLWLIYIFKR